VLVRGATDGRFVPTGHLVYMRLGDLMASPFDPIASRSPAVRCPPCET
jgi:hypothetical protein